MVAQSDRSDVAALSSYRCAELYGLQCLESTCAGQRQQPHPLYLHLP